MRTAMRVCAIVALACCGIGARPAAADHLFSPSDEQWAGWIRGGVEAAEQDAALLQVPGVRRWLFVAGGSGQVIVPGRTLRLVIVASPELIGTLVGWEADWDAALYEKMHASNEAKAKVVEDLTKQAKAAVDGKSLFLLVGYSEVAGSGGRAVARQQSTLDYAVYGGGRWYQVVEKGSPEEGAKYARTEKAPDRVSGEWAARYLLGVMAARQVFRADSPAIMVQPLVLDAQASFLKRDFAATTNVAGLGDRTARILVGNRGQSTAVDMDFGP